MKFVEKNEDAIAAKQLELKARDQSKSSIQCIPFQSRTPKDQREKKSDLPEQDKWLSSVIPVVVKAVNADASIDPNVLIKMQWLIYVELFEKTIEEGTDMSALEDVSILYYVCIA